MTTTADITKLSYREHLVYQILYNIDYVFLRTTMYQLPRIPKQTPKLIDQHHEIRKLWMDPWLILPSDNPPNATLISSTTENEDRFVLNPLIWYIYNHRPQLREKYNRTLHYPAIRRIPTAHSPDSPQHRSYAPIGERTGNQRRQFNEEKFKWFYSFIPNMHAVDVTIVPFVSTLEPTFDRTNPLSIPRYFYHEILIERLLHPREFIILLQTIPDKLFEDIRTKYFRLADKTSSANESTIRKTPSEWQASEDTEDLSSF